MNARGTFDAKQSSLFGPVTDPRSTPLPPPRRKPRVPTLLDRDFAYFQDRFITVRREPLLRVSRADDYRSLKRLQALVPDEAVRHALLDLWVEDTAPFVVAHGHLLRYALVEWRFLPLLKQAEARVAAQRPVARPVDTGPAQGAKDALAARIAVQAARARIYRRRHGESVA